MQVQEMAFKQLNKLKVIYCGWGEKWELGQLAASTVRGRYVFEYTPQALKHGIQFSPYKMPLSNQIYTDFEDFQSYLPGFVADSLPDGWGWLLMDRFLRRNNVNPQRVSMYGLYRYFTSHFHDYPLKPGKRNPGKTHGF